MSELRRTIISASGSIDLSEYLLKEEAETLYATLDLVSLKANDTAVVHKVGDESIAGTKTFNGVVHFLGTARPTYEGVNLAILSDISSKQDTLVSGTNIKTINGQTILGSGDIAISGGSIDTSNFATKTELAQKQDNISDIDTIRSNAANYKGTVTGVKIDNVSKTPSSGVVDLGYVNKKLITSSSSSMTLFPNFYYRNTSTSLSSLTIILGSGDNGNIINEYFVEFTTSSSGTTVSFPSTVKWANGETPTFEAGCTYQVSIVNHLGTIQKFK